MLLTVIVSDFFFDFLDFLTLFFQVFILSENQCSNIVPGTESDILVHLLPIHF